jgi:hypothetical protein
MGTHADSTRGRACPGARQCRVCYLLAFARDGNVNWLTSFKQKDRPKAASVFAIAIDHAASIALLRRR